MKRPPQSRIILHGMGTGDLTDDDVEKRARELALIRGRPAERVTEEDRAEAWAELHGEHLPDNLDTDHESRGALSRDPSEPVAVSGHQVHAAEDESMEVERLAYEGLEEAQHDQMLASRLREHRHDYH